jgi:phosphoribosylformylglycinamidine synthase
MGDAVSSADTGAFGSGIELNAIQRLIQKCKRAANAIRGLVTTIQLFLFMIMVQVV